MASFVQATNVNNFTVVKMHSIKIETSSVDDFLHKTTTTKDTFLIFQLANDASGALFTSVS